METTYLEGEENENFPEQLFPRHVFPWEQRGQKIFFSCLLGFGRKLSPLRALLSLLSSEMISETGLKSLMSQLRKQEVGDCRTGTGEMDCGA